MASCSNSAIISPHGFDVVLTVYLLELRQMMLSQQSIHSLFYCILSTRTALVISKLVITIRRFYRNIGREAYLT